MYSFIHLLCDVLLSDVVLCNVMLCAVLSRGVVSSGILQRNVRLNIRSSEGCFLASFDKSTCYIHTQRYTSTMLPVCDQATGAYGQQKRGE